MLLIGISSASGGSSASGNILTRCSALCLTNSGIQTVLIERRLKELAELMITVEYRLLKCTGKF